jgi:hypothetical protein
LDEAEAVLQSLNRVRLAGTALTDARFLVETREVGLRAEINKARDAGATMEQIGTELDRPLHWIDAFM